MRNKNKKSINSQHEESDKGSIMESDHNKGKTAAKLKSWQTHLGGWGSLIWITSFQINDLLDKHDLHVASLTVIGYTMGFITALAGHLLWGYALKGRLKEIIADNGKARWISAFSLFIISLYGAIGFLIGIFGSNPWYYSIAFAIGALVINQGVMPIIDDFDRKHHP